MRVLHVTETAKGGVGTYLDELLPHQIAQFGENSVRVIVPEQHRSQIPSVDDAMLLPYDRPDRSLASLRRLRAGLKSELARFRPDILHLHSSFAGMIGRLNRWSRQGPAIIVQPHGWSFEIWPPGPKRGLAIAVERSLQSRCDRIVAVSQAEKRQATDAGLDGDGVSVILNGIAPDGPLPRTAKWDDPRRKVLFIGRLDRQKGLDTLARIASRNIERLSFRVAGEAVAGGQSETDFPQNLTLLGWCDRTMLEAHLQACDLLAMPSRWEAFGLTALEAMRAGKPVIAFAVGGLPEIVTNAETGCLVEAGDEAAFERALIEPSTDALRRMGVMGRDRFARYFHSGRMAEEIGALYREVSA